MPPKKGQNSLQEEVQLIDAVRDRPCLWNKLHPDFKNLIKKEAAWLEVGKLLGKEGEFLDISMILVQFRLIKI